MYKYLTAIPLLHGDEAYDNFCIEVPMSFHKMFVSLGREIYAEFKDYQPCTPFQDEAKWILSEFYDCLLSCRTGGMPFAPMTVEQFRKSNPTFDDPCFCKNEVTLTPDYHLDLATVLKITESEQSFGEADGIITD